MRFLYHKKGKPEQSKEFVEFVVVISVTVK